VTARCTRYEARCVIAHQPAISGDSSSSKNHPAATKATMRPTVLSERATPLLEVAGSDECVFIP
jgi:hypothetical protein